PRQGAKRRTVSSQLGAADFDAFPEHTGSQAPAAPSLPPAGQLPCGGTTQAWLRAVARLARTEEYRG
ncbi:unnamed protein product, partial [Prorocentrum cordatum]